MKKCAMLLFCDNNLIPALGNTLIQLKKFNFIDNIIIEHTIDDENIIEVLKQIDQRCIFTHVDDKMVYEKITFDIKNNIYMKMYGVPTFYKFFAFRYLEEFENIIISDIDMCFLSDFSDIISDAPIAYKSRGWLNQYIDVPNQYTIPNCGLIVINKKILDYCNNITDELFSIVNEFYTLNSLDEIAFAMLIYKFNIPLNVLDKELYNSTPISNNARKASIVHGASPYKFWEDPSVNFIFPEWNDANNKWNQLCKDNGINNYSFNLDEKFFLSEKNIIDMYFNIVIYKEIYNINNDFIIYMNEKWNFIKIYINGYPEDFHFEISRVGKLIRVMIHDENSYRINSMILKKSFYTIMNKIENIKTRNINGRIEVFLICEKNKIKDTLSYMYRCIKDDINKYFELEKILKEFKLLNYTV